VYSESFEKAENEYCSVQCLRFLKYISKLALTTVNVVREATAASGAGNCSGSGVGVASSEGFVDGNGVVRDVEGASGAVIVKVIVSEAQVLPWMSVA